MLKSFRCTINLHFFIIKQIHNILPLSLQFYVIIRDHSGFSLVENCDLVWAARGPLFCSYRIMTSYCVSITEQTTAKCSLFVK